MAGVSEVVFAELMNGAVNNGIGGYPVNNGGSWEEEDICRSSDGPSAKLK